MLTHSQRRESDQTLDIGIMLQHWLTKQTNGSQQCSKQLACHDIMNQTPYCAKGIGTADEVTYCLLLQICRTGGAGNEGKTL